MTTLRQYNIQYIYMIYIQYNIMKEIFKSILGNVFNQPISHADFSTIFNIPRYCILIWYAVPRCTLLCLGVSYKDMKTENTTIIIYLKPFLNSN